MGQKVVSVPVLVALGVLADGSKQLLAMELCTSESREAWQGFVEALGARGLRAPLLCIVDGSPGLRGALERCWPQARVQRCTVHKLRNLERKAPAHALEAIKDAYHRIVYAAFVRKWKKSCPGVVASLEEGGDELLTFSTTTPFRRTFVVWLRFAPRLRERGCTRSGAAANGIG